MARKTAGKSARKPAKRSAPKASETFDQESLTKGQLRKLNALKKSVGDEIGMDAFGKWLAGQAAGPKAPVDKNAAQIVGALEALIDAKKLRIPRGGYLVKRGRGRVIVTRPETT